MYVLTEAEGGRRTGFGSNYRPQVYIRTAGMSKYQINQWKLDIPAVRM
jgi:translation elongation factor EF-Tu-like GTPase